jgi:hypothetical protein
MAAPVSSANEACCVDERRKDAVRAHATLNGIDYVEYHEDLTLAPPRFWLSVVFLKNAPAGLGPGSFHIEGGIRIPSVRPTAVAPAADPLALEVDIEAPGDFSVYTLTVDGPGIDGPLAAAPVRFKADCPSELDCRQAAECPPEPADAPALDYLAKDYASFRRLLLDLVPQRNPRWTERNPADLGMVLVELLAYEGDQLSYFQDAVATESYLDTCRHRISARRHARLVDYRMHDGRNAWSFVQLTVGDPIVVPAGTLLLTRIDKPLNGGFAPPGAVIPREDLDFDSDPALRGVIAFETAVRTAAAPLNAEIRLHTWGDRECCLPRGATHAVLYVNDAGTAVRPPLAAGDYLVLEEVKGPATGLEADADPAHRCVVRLTAVAESADLVYGEDLLDGEPQPVAGQTLPILEVTWREEDALPFALCLSARHPETGELITRVSVARGNVIPCDHGRTVVEALALPVSTGSRSARAETRLPRGPLTFQAMPPVPGGLDTPRYDAELRLEQPRHALGVPAREAQPAVVLRLGFPPAEEEIWIAVPDLLDSHPLDRHFVAEVDNDGRAVLRFGDDEHGRRPGEEATSVTARYRIGNGVTGNLGRESLAHIARPLLADMADPAAGPADPPPPPWPNGLALTVWQPLPAAGGVDPETIEEVRQLAPRAFQAETLRAVTEEDWEAAARKLPWVAAAKCAFRWTGSWHTVFVALHPRDAADLITEGGGKMRLRDERAQQALAHLTRYKLAGYDLEVRAAQYVPLEIDLQLCIARGHFRGDVLAGVYRALSSRRNADGSLGFFHPERFAFGQPVPISRIYAVVEKVPGVESALITVFKRYWAAANHELEDGLIPLGDDEIARLDNDPNFADNGVLRLTALGGL